MQTGTYIIHDGKIPFYVGKGSKKRAHSHLRKSHSTQVNRKIAKMRREGREPYVQFIPAPDDEHAKEMECLLIAMIGRRDLGLGPLLNGTDGGEGVCGISEETRAKLSVSRKGKSPANKGKSSSDETKAKISAAKMGKRLSEKTRLQMSISRTGISVGPPSQKTKQKISTALNKPCTVDGITIYESRNALILGLGQGKNGLKHPNFHYLENVLERNTK